MASPETEPADVSKTANAVIPPDQQQSFVSEWKRTQAAMLGWDNLSPREQALFRVAFVEGWRAFERCAVVVQ